MSYSWYSYNGITSSLNPLEYSKLSASPTCLHGNKICAIYAETQLVGNPLQEKPFITSALAVEIIIAEVTYIPSVNVKLKPV